MQAIQRHEDHRRHTLPNWSDAAGRLAAMLFPQRLDAAGAKMSLAEVQVTGRRDTATRRGNTQKRRIPNALPGNGRFVLAIVKRRDLVAMASNTLRHQQSTFTTCPDNRTRTK
ncbi:uncharacterized protein ATNIH1004_004488 [Aspergillus tanneri]|uniref:Uncharacterized protein n=1 Tax=Aspergillus tanneri TaxID=1220188 RepID=A0A5M9MUP2_9EURO|nr:uncharacterized protein ATNIH1004_004488 [Aspergillus tanneri]KAA8648603.1 hypothetical protein ATNIH1004_004488 [Aspergillus tanneri]